MANTEQARKAEARKRARLEAQQRAEEQSQRDTAARPNEGREEPVRLTGQPRSNVTPQPRVQKKTPKEMRMEAQAVAERQAAQDALLKPPRLEDVKIEKGRTFTLHELNQRSRFVHKTNRDEARDAANAAGKAAFDVLRGRKDNKSQLHDRYKNRNKMMANLGKGATQPGGGANTESAQK